MPRRTIALTEEDLLMERCLRRLRADLGVNAAGAEVIWHMRQQMLELQQRIQQLEAELEHYTRRRGARLARYRESYYEALWEEQMDSE